MYINTESDCRDAWLKYRGIIRCQWAPKKGIQLQSCMVNSNVNDICPDTTEGFTILA